MPKFTEQFDSFICVGDSIDIDVGNVTYRATVHHDEDNGIDDDDSHNVDQKVTGCNDEQQKELIAAREAWFNNEWFFCGIVLDKITTCPECNQESTENLGSLWAIEANYPDSNNKYLRDIANELLEEHTS